MTYKIYPFRRDNKYRFYVRFEDENGEERNLSTGVTMPLRHTNKQRKEAEKQAQKEAKKRVLKAMGMHNPAVRQQIQKLREFLNQTYYPYLKTNRAKSTVTSYQIAHREFLRICGNRPLEVYNKTHFNDYKIHRYNEDGIKKTTINIELRSIKAAFSWAYKQDYITHFAFKGQEYMFDVPSTRREFKDYELQRLFKQTEGKMIGLAIQLAYYTGMRQGELTDTTWRMINHKQRYIHLPGKVTKSGKPRQVPLNSKAFNIVKILENILKNKRSKHPQWYKNKPFEECYLLQKERGFGKYQKRSVQDMFRKEMNKAELPKELKFHCLRHSFATNCLENGGNMYGVSKIMGHSTPQVTSDFYDHTTALNYRSVAELLC